MITAKDFARRALSRLGLLNLYFWLLERRKSFGREAPPATDEHGVPLPPLKLMARVVAHADWRAFLKTGAANARTLNDYAAQAGIGFADAARILDFGCGCGRIIRRLPQMTKARLYGVDYNPSLVRWCAENLEGEFAVNALTPPLVFPDAHFDVVYLVSVFTHLRVDTQRQWLPELQRIIRPGGVAIVTFHDEMHPGLPKTEEAVAAISQTGVFIYNDMAEGSNLIATFQTQAFTNALFAANFDVMRIVSSRDCPLGQAAAILRRRTEEPPDEKNQHPESL